MRLARSRPPGDLTTGFAAAVLIACLGWACHSPSTSDTTWAAWTLEPASPETGRDTRALLTLRDPSGAPVRGARIQIEAHMGHPGMAPLVTTAAERADGVYEAQLTFTMRGPWTLVASGTLSDGHRLTRTHDVVGVR